MEQCAGKRGKIPYFLPFAQLLNLYCAEGNLCLAKSPRNQLQVGAGPNQDSDAKLAVLALRGLDRGQVFLDDADHLPRFRIFGCSFLFRAGPGDTEKRPYLDSHVAARRWTMRAGWGEGHLVFLSCAGSENLGEDLVQSLDQSGMRAKISLQLQRCQLHSRRSFSEPVTLGSFKKLHFSLAKHVDRLHRIAYQEAAASTRGLPPAGNQGEQFVLATRGILKLVHQQMRPAGGNIGGQFARLALVVAQDLLRGQTQFDKVHHPTLGENQAQLRDGITQDDQHVLQHLRVFFGVRLGR
jgi:hypothetical protein